MNCSLFYAGDGEGNQIILRRNNSIDNLVYTKHFTVITSYNSSEQPYELGTIIVSIFQVKQRHREVR